MEHLFDRIVYHFIRKPLYNFLQLFSTLRMPEASDDYIDVIIPIVAKDLAILPYCLEGIRKNVVNRIKKIYLVGPVDQQIIDFAANHNLFFVDEKSVLGFSPSDVNYKTSTGRDRSGWLFQQFLKLSGNIGECENYITIDSDHILLRPHVFISQDGKYVFYRSEEFHWPYLIANKKLLGHLRIPLLSYVAHKMVFNKNILKELQKQIEVHSGKCWTDAIVDSLDRNDPSAFSEFEMYGSFVNSKNKRSKLWLQKIDHRSGDINIEELKSKYKNNLSVTFPDYLN